VWVVGHLGPDDFEHLLETVPESRRNMTDEEPEDKVDYDKILLPGTVICCASLEAAKK